MISQAIIGAVKKEGAALLNWDEDVEQWQNRVLTMNTCYPEDGFLDVSTKALLATTEKWLLPYLNDINSPDDFKKINLKEVLQYSLTSALQKN